jgi:hypothetical protein
MVMAGKAVTPFRKAMRTKSQDKIRNQLPVESFSIQPMRNYGRLNKASRKGRNEEMVGADHRTLVERS